MENMKKPFDTVFKDYCERRKIVYEENAYGAFMVPNDALEQCLDVVQDYKDKLNEKLKDVQKHSFKGQSNLNYNCQFSGKDKKIKYKKQKVPAFYINARVQSNNMFLADLDLNICLCNTSSTVPAKSIFSLSVDYILNTANNGREIYDSIFKDIENDANISNYEASILPLSFLLQRFQKQHKKFNYYSVLKHLVQKETCNQKVQCEYEVTVKQLRSFFDLVLHKVVPPQLFGKIKNMKKIKKALFLLLNTRAYERLNLKPFIEKLDISSITWLKNIKDIKTQWIIVSALVKWFFCNFMIKIIRIQLHVTTLSHSTEGRLYVRRSDWCNIQKKFIKKKLNMNHLDIKQNMWNPPIGMYNLILKSSGIRPVFKTKFTKSEQRDLYVILKFLKQIYVTKYGLTNWHEEWKSLVQQKCDWSNKKFYLVSCDVTDAFGSITQELLYNIILSLSEELPETLKLMFYGTESKHFKMSTVSYKQYFCDSNLQLPFSPGTLYACNNHMESRLIKKRWLLLKIWKYIFYQRVSIRNKNYIVGKGVVQGTILSPIFSDLYYTFLLQGTLATFMKSGKMIRYMDDILYVTISDESAKLFLEFTKKGIPRYNCRFKMLKTQTNVNCTDNLVVNTIRYIGHEINCSTLDIKPDITNTDISYFTIINLETGLTPIQCFRKKLNYTAVLKLSKLVLNTSVNSNETILRILSEASKLQAKRASLMIQQLFDNIHQNSSDIIKVIKASNKMIAMGVIRTFITNNENMNRLDMIEWNRKILCIFQESYTEVFHQSKILQNSFPQICLV